MLTNGQILNNRYRILSLLGQGGMGAAYRAFDLTLQHECVVKELVLQGGFSAGAAQQFQREAQTLANLNHSRLPRVTDYFQLGGNYYLVMDYVPGQSLDKLIGAGMNESVARGIAEQMLEVLGYIHAQGVLHRDIKPENIIIRNDGQVVLVDFGLVKAINTHTQPFLQGYGTAAYAAPEQYSGGTDTRSDLYSLGATLYHALTGVAPVAGADRMAGAVLPNPCQLRPGLSPALAGVVLKAMAMNRQDRFQSAAEFRAALHPPAPPPPPAPSPKQNSPLKVVVVLVFGLVLLCAGGNWLLTAMGNSRPPSSPAAPATESRPAATAPLPDPPSVPTDVPINTNAPTDEPIPPTSAPEPDTPAPATDPPTTTPAVETEQPFSRQDRLGTSAGGRAIEVRSAGWPSASRAIVVVGGVAGSEQNDTPLVAQGIADYYLSDPARVPKDTQVHVVPNINPDGFAGSGRFNAHGVDLNRNWDSNWTPDPPIIGKIKPGAGGSAPFSEPETRALRDLLMTLKREGREVIVVILHSSAKAGMREVYPGYTSAGADAESEKLARRVAGALGFDYRLAGSDPTTGESISWTANNGIPAIDIFWSRPSGNQPSTPAMTNVIAQIAQ